jgi:hypothetical protein
MSSHLHKPKKDSHALRNTLILGAAVAIGVICAFSLDGAKPKTHFNSKKPLVSDSVNLSTKPHKKNAEEQPFNPIFSEKKQTPEFSGKKEVKTEPPKPQEKKIEPPKPKPLTRKELLLRLLRSQYVPESLYCQFTEEEKTEQNPKNLDASISGMMKEFTATNDLVAQVEDMSNQKFEELVDNATVEKDLDSLIPAFKYMLSLNLITEEESGKFEIPFMEYLSIAAKKRAGLSGVGVDEDCLLKNLNAFKQMAYVAMGICDIFSETGDSERIFSEFPKEQHSLIISLFLSNSIEQLSTDPNGFQNLFLSLSEENRKLMLQHVSTFHKTGAGNRGRETLIMNLINVTTDQELKNNLMEIMVGSSSN